MIQSQTGTIVQSLADFAAHTPRAPAFVDATGVLDFGDLWDAARRRAAWLFRQGVRAGDVVAISFDADPALARRPVEQIYAAALLGAVALPLQPEVPQAACEEVMAHFGARWLLAQGAPVQVAGARSIDPRGYEAVPGNFATDEVERADLPQAPLFYSLTSGTSGAPKALLYTHAQFHGSVLAGARSIGIGPDDRQMTAVDWPSNVGLRYLMRAHAAGAAFVAAPFRDSRVPLAQTLERFGVTRLALSPWQVRRLVQSPAPVQGMPPLRCLHIIGAFISPEEVEQAKTALTPNTYVGYGSVEIGAATLLGPDDEILAGCVGRPIEGVQAKVVPTGATPDENGLQIGELAFRADWVCTGYAGNPEATRAHFRDGWHFPGDVGAIDTQGRVWLRGRSVEVINFGGLKIWPEDVEAVLKRHPAVADAAVAALPDAMAGQVPAAFIVARGMLTEQSLRAHCAAHLEGARIPPHIVVVEKIPRNANGKVLRQALVDAHFAAINDSARWRAGRP